MPFTRNIDIFNDKNLEVMEKGEGEGGKCFENLFDFQNTKVQYIYACVRYEERVHPALPFCFLSITICLR